MRPLFTVHAGEYLAGSFIEKHLKQFDLWIPSRDTGIDLLMTNPRNSNRAGLQVKFSKDFLATNMSSALQKDLLACGWWTLNGDKLKKSRADFWIFVLYSFDNRQTQYVIIRPAKLLSNLNDIYGNLKVFNIYLWVTRRSKCWEARSLKKSDQLRIAKNSYSDSRRDFTMFLNDWDTVKKVLK